MSRPWYVHLGWWLCEKTGHLRRCKGWAGNGRRYRQCALCGRILNEPLEE